MRSDRRETHYQREYSSPLVLVPVMRHVAPIRLIQILCIKIANTCIVCFTDFVLFI